MAVGDLHFGNEAEVTLPPAPPVTPPPVIETPAVPPPAAAPPAPAAATGARRYADENADGSLKDTSGLSVTSTKQLSAKFLADGVPKTEPVEEPKAEEPKKDEPPVAPPAAVEPPKTDPPADAVAAPADKMYADKFKSPEELEKGYKELQTQFGKLSREAAEAKKVAEAAKTVTEAEAAKIKEEEANEKINEFLKDPQGYEKKLQDQVQQNIQAAETANKVMGDWRTANADVVEYEYFVGVEMQRLSQADPTLLDGNQLLKTATDNVRTVIGKIRDEGRKEALAVRQTQVPLTPNVPTSPAQSSAKKTPMSADEAFNAEISRLKAEERRTTGR